MFIKPAVSYLLYFIATSSSLYAESDCNPLRSKKACPPNNALSMSLVETFVDEPSLFSIYSTPEKVEFTEEGLVLMIDSRFQNPGIQSKFYIMFGKVEVILKAAPGNGIISSFYLQSDSLDEIDIEWFGGDRYEVQSNYFSKGNVSNYGRGGYHPVENPQVEFHNYTIDWTEEELTWYVDSRPVRTLLNSSTEGYPQTPMRLFAGMWVGGDEENSSGTIDWAGGIADYVGIPYSMIISKLVVTDYSSGSLYRYRNKSGKWTSIQSVGGTVNGRKDLANTEFTALVNGEEIYQFDRRNDKNENEASLTSGNSIESSNEYRLQQLSNTSNGSLPGKIHLGKWVIFLFFLIVLDFF